jgi:hypothetical protein
LEVKSRRSQVVVPAKTLCTGTKVDEKGPARQNAGLV